ncbi:MAG TPA: hypothetical protein PLT82_00745 [Candidatus Hydrogenedens sp.]|nr:hypothetical protein [Candidatus Hydrogenedens sp.]HOK08348.1 hypothetical protein [Candidatus Hydrogenedens sp.]HOL20587.1 hypothetical protein [Candidatus Hydrogenedens sp.]HPP57642.1 hypothetical protein [Candidatus Hydrogenedens sp.]
MPLFGWGNSEKKPTKEEVRPIPGRQIYCRICNGDRMFSRAWRRISHMTTCPCCGLEFPNLQEVYKRFQPVCPRCEEPLEQPGFDYGICDGCGSKYEITEGCKPGLLPNYKQRQEMNKYGKAWSPYW